MKSPSLLAVSLLFPVIIHAADAPATRLVPLVMEMTQSSSGDVSGLIDEQSLGESLKDNGEPTKAAENSWKPDAAGDRGNYPLEVIIDLGQERTLSHILFYDMHGEGNIAVAGGSPDEWKDLFVEDGVGYLRWKNHPLNNLKTRYLKLTKEDAHARFGEMLVFEVVPSGDNPAVEKKP